MYPTQKLRGFKELLSRLERITLEFGSNNSLDVYSGAIGPIPMEGLPVQDKGYNGVLIKNPDSSQEGYMIIVDFGNDTGVLCDVVPAVPHYITFRRDEKLVAALYHNYFLKNKRKKDAIDRGEWMLDKEDIKVTLPILYILDGTLFPQPNILNDALRNEFGYGLDIKYDEKFLFPQTVETPPMLLDYDPKKLDEKWKTGEGWETLKITAIVYEVPIKTF